MTLLPGILLLLLSLAALGGCTGGDDSAEVTTGPAWPKFRHDETNSGLGAASVGNNPGAFKWPTPGVSIDGSPISASPAIDTSGTVYVGSEGGTLAAVNPNGTIKWTTDCCTACGGTCPSSEPSLGALVSSPAIYTRAGTTSVFVGSTTGAVYFFTDGGSEALCAACFQPAKLDTTITAASFVSSPAFTTDPSTLRVSAVFIGAAIQRAGSTDQTGKLYAINNDGSLQWVYPRTGDIAPITSSPALGVGGGVFFTDRAGSIYALTGGGSFLWQFATAPPAAEAGTGIAPSAMTTLNAIYTSTANGEIIGVNPDGSLRWRVSRPGEAFTSSLATGSQAETTPTRTPTGAPTPTPTVPPAVTTTATATATPIPLEAPIFGITNSGTLVVVVAPTGDVISPTGPLPISGAVVSSPALSSDGFLVFGTDDGMLYVVNTATALPPSDGWPVPLTTGASIRSSPAIGPDGTIYVGADDGRLYAVGP
jgi:outer membrane protein assembly factor BamB